MYIIVRGFIQAVDGADVEAISQKPNTFIYIMICTYV